MQSIFICFVAIFFALTIASPLDDGIDRVKRSVDHVHNLMFNQRLRLPLDNPTTNRHKRQADWRTVDSEYDQSTLCILNCANQLQRAAKQYRDDDDTTTQTTQANQLMKPAFNLTRLTTVCSAMRPSVECFDRCQASTLKNQIQKSLEPIRFICIDRYQDFLNNLRCMHKLDATSSQQCTPRCRRFEAAVNKTTQLAQRPYLRHFYTVAELKEMLSGTCQYVQCYMDCSVPLTRSVCGDTAANLASGLIQKMFASVQNYDQVTSGGSILPESCQRLARPTGTEMDNGDDIEEAVADSDANSWREPSNQGGRVNSNRPCDDDATIIFVVPVPESNED